MDDHASVAACDEGSLRAALELLYQHLRPDTRAVQIEQARRDLNPSDVWRAGAAEKPAGVLLAHFSAGKTGWLMSPVLATAPGATGSTTQELARLLIARAAEDLERRGARLVHTLLALRSALAAAFQAAGFARITEIVRMVRAADPPVAPPIRVPGVELVEADCTRREMLLRWLDETSRGSLDCPELEGLRPAAEVLESYQEETAAVRSTQRVFVARRGAALAGGILIRCFADEREVELQYMGVLPAERGRGIGRALTARALEAARESGAQRVAVSADVRNRPAIEIYRSLGFRESERRAVWVRVPGRSLGARTDPELSTTTAKRISPLRKNSSPS
jgi:GNAT superfamily N-acetyltransferase